MVLASLAIIAAIACGFVVLARLSLGQQAPFDPRHGVFFILFFGWPVALLFCVILGALVERWEQERKRRVTAVGAAVSSGVVGATVLVLAWLLFWGSGSGMSGVSFIGFLAGVLGGLVFWASRDQPAGHSH